MQKVYTAPAISIRSSDENQIPVPLGSFALLFFGCTYVHNIHPAALNVGRARVAQSGRSSQFCTTQRRPLFWLEASVIHALVSFSGQSSSTRSRLSPQQQGEQNPPDAFSQPGSEGHQHHNSSAELGLLPCTIAVQW